MGVNVTVTFTLIGRAGDGSLRQEQIQPKWDREDRVRNGVQEESDLQSPWLHDSGRHRIQSGGSQSPKQVSNPSLQMRSPGVEELIEGNYRVRYMS